MLQDIGGDRREKRDAGHLGESPNEELLDAVFRNDPTAVATTFAWLLGAPRFAGAFDRVVFAIYDRRPGQATLAAFRRVFAA